MKTKIGLLVALLFAVVFSVNAQGQRRTVEERVKSAMEKLEPLKLDKDQLTKTEAIFTDSYKEQQKAMEEMRNSGSVDRDAMMAARKKSAEARDEKLKKVFTDDQYKKFKDEIEATMQPQRGGGNSGKN
jgi:periplasmic protein CpxP/Spy